MIVASRKAVSPASGETGGESKPKYELITQKETLRFVYMNAGYLINGIGSLLTFTDLEEDGEWDRLTVRRYSLSGGETEKWNLPLRPWNRQP